jgi:streptogramin lyase/mono/diheme cytochrome c family protein
MSTRRTRYQAGLAIMAVGALMVTLSVKGAEENLLTGTITSTAGAPIEGVAVSAQVAGEPITTSVYTGADGRYFFPAMKGSQYKVWAQAVGLERAEAVADLAAGTKRLDFKMKDTTELVPQLSGYQIVSALPEDTVAHRRGKVLFQKNCTYCHETATALRDRFDQHGWEIIVDVMTNGFNPSNRKELAPWQKELAAYLTEMRGPAPSPMKPLQVFRPKGEATLPVVYEYDVEYLGGGFSTHNGSDWRFGQASSAGGAVGMHDAALDGDGNFWLTSTRASETRTVARVDGKTGKTTDFAVLKEDGKSARVSHGIYPGSDGRIYFNASPQIPYLDGLLGIIDPKTQKVEGLKAPAGVGGWLNEDAKGFIWTQSGTMKEGGAIRFDPRTKKFDVFKSPTAGLTYGVAGDVDGNGWWMGVNEDIIVHGEAATGKVTEIQLPVQPATEYVKAGDFAEGEDIPRRGLGGKQSPRRPSADLKNPALWVPNFYGNTLLRIDTRTKALKYYPMPYAAMNPYEAMVDSQGRVWVTFQNSDELGRFEPDKGTWTIYSYPTKGMAQRQNHMREKDGVLQFVSASGPGARVGRMVMRSAGDVQALRDRAR